MSVSLAMSGHQECVIAWYDPAEWETWRTSCEDGAMFFGVDYPTWKRLAEAAIDEKRQAGVEIRKILIRVESFLQWVHANSKPTTSQSRAAYAGIIAVDPEPESQ